MQAHVLQEATCKENELETAFHGIELTHPLVLNPSTFRHKGLRPLERLRTIRDAGSRAAPRAISDAGSKAGPRAIRDTGFRAGPRAIRDAGSRAGLETVFCMTLDNFYADFLHIVSLPSNSFCFLGQFLSSPVPQFPHTVDPESVFNGTVMFSYIRTPSSLEQHLTCGQ